LLRPAAAARAIALHFDGAEGLPPLRVDAARIIQVLGNLVGNAIKFTPEGGRVSVTCVEARGSVELSVTDTGPGIPADQVSHIFGAFWQARDDDHRGIGLGLWIARSIVEAHGGSIGVESQEGRGTTFRFTLPLASIASADEPDLPSRMIPVPALVTDSGAVPQT
jgi:signal transduction histidine kinase